MEKEIKSMGLTSQNMKAVLRLLEKANNEQLDKIILTASARLKN